MKASELTGAALDWAVAKCEGDDPRILGTSKSRVHLWWTVGVDANQWKPSTDWAQGGPILERERISIEPAKTTGKWSAFKFDTGDCEFYVDTPLEAAMRCYVASKLGDDVDVPEELK